MKSVDDNLPVEPGFRGCAAFVLPTRTPTLR